MDGQSNQQQQHQTPVLSPPTIPTNTVRASLDSKSITVILLLVFFYPLGVILMWAWMKTWPRWMKLLLSSIFILGIFAIALAFYMTFLPFSQKASNTYIPKQPDEYVSITPEPTVLNKSTGNKMFDQADDTARRSSIQLLDSGLKKYYAENRKSPATLSDLVPEYLASEDAFLDIRTKEPMQYIATHPTRGCIVSTPLITTNETIYAYCK